MEIDLKKALKFAELLAKETGEYILSKRNEIEVKAYKDRRDIVTNVDLAAEKLIIDEIRNKYPDHAIFSEEAGDDNRDASFKWIIDPVDGTKEYTRGLPQYNTCFALEDKGEPVLAVVYKPTSGELYSAAKGLGSFLNGEKLQVSDEKELKNAYVFAYLPTYKLDEAASITAYSKLQKLSKSAYRLRGIAEESMGLCWVASGKIEAAINLGPQPKWHDIVPGLMIAKEAGAKLTDARGQDLVSHDLKNGFVVSNGLIHEELVSKLDND
jgi:myo-inositol-1(or 4)-monophosphatase